ncbi:TPR-like protein [Chiua virens]|nr:TPR-like protein [Chiua virens]
MDVSERLDKANELKLEGNELFKASKWNEALVSYRTALGYLPPRKPSAEPELVQANSDSPEPSQQPPAGDLAVDAVTDPSDLLDSQCAKARAVLHANIATGQENHDGVVDECSQALSDDPHYVKALQRRATSNERIDTWTSLASAQEDYKLLLELLPPGSVELSQTKKALRSLEPRARAAQEKETAEMMGKLKGLGNTILGMPVFREFNDPSHDG